MKRRHTILLVVLIMALSVLFISCDPLHNLHEVDEVVLVTETLNALIYIASELDINLNNPEIPISITHTLPSSYNEYYRKEAQYTFLYPTKPKFVTAGSEVKLVIAEDEDAVISTITIKSKDIPGRKAKIVITEVDGKPSHTLNGKPILIPND